MVDEAVPQAALLSRVWWLVFATAFVWIALQRRDEPLFARDVALIALALIPIVVDDILDDRVRWTRRIPQFVWSLPLLIAVLVVIWQPVNSDFAPTLLVLVVAHATIKGTVADGLLVLAGSAAVMIGSDAGGHFTGSLTWVLGLVLTWAGAFSVRYMLHLVGELRAAQAGLAERAAEDERQRIAREIHDVTAHTLSVAALHITGARMAVQRDRADALHALEEAERLTRESLAQIRAVMGVLEPGGDGTKPAMPTATDIPALVDECAAAGVHVDLAIDGDLAQVPAGAGLALYRVTQESLSNVVRHAPAPAARVRIAVCADQASVTVTNPLGNGAARAPAWGRGLHGMDERSRAHFGTFEAGPVDGEWRVSMTIPAEKVDS